MADKLIPVTSEAQLRIGMLVELRSCGVCGRAHRQLLMKPLDSPAACSRCGDRVSSHFSIATVLCAFGDALFTCVKLAIPERRLFIVDTGLEDEESPYVERPLTVAGRIQALAWYVSGLGPLK